MSHDTWIHRVSRFAVAGPLARTPVTPSQVTSVRLATGIAAAVMVGTGVDLWRDVGAGLFVLSVLLDRADGDLARLTGRTSPGGHKYDLVADAASNTLILFGLGVGLRDGGFGLMAVPMGALAGAAVAAILWMVMRMEELKGHRSGELPGFRGFDVDDAVLLIPVLIWLDQAEGLLVAAAVIAPLVAALFLGMFRRLLRSADSQ